MAQLAFEAGDTDRAEAWAREAVRIPEVIARMPPDPSPFDPWPSHMGHIVLGKIALVRGDLDGAERRLEPAGQHRPGALLSRPPDFDLAHEILARDRVQPVVSYLEACRDMWIIGEESIDRWAAEIRAGQRPILDARSIKASPQLQMKVLRRLLHEFRDLRARLKDLRRNR